MPAVIASKNQSVGQKPDLTGNIQYILHILFNIIGYIPCIGIYPLVSTDISLGAKDRFLVVTSADSYNNKP